LVVAVAAVQEVVRRALESLAALVAPAPMAEAAAVAAALSTRRRPVTRARVATEATAS
jgi:hypothetical protein